MDGVGELPRVSGWLRDHTGAASMGRLERLGRETRASSDDMVVVIVDM
jgi:hypothetical protein